MSDTSSTNDASLPIFKKWHKTGFVTITYWASADKVIVDIGSLDSDGRLKQATKCYVPGPDVVAYLYAEISNQLEFFYPKFAAEGYVSYGGSKTPTGPVSRVFKSTYWGQTKDRSGDVTARAFKCAHFEGKLTSQGAITPIYDKGLSMDQVRITMTELSIMYHRIVAAQHAQAVAVALGKPLSDVVSSVDDRQPEPEPAEHEPLDLAEPVSEPATGDLIREF